LWLGKTTKPLFVFPAIQVFWTFFGLDFVKPINILAFAFWLNAWGLLFGPLHIFPFLN
jgi:hypothetical protein